MAVGLVLVSHSAKIAEGLVELARQMAPTVALVAAGGTDEGGIGTSFEKVSTGILEADGGDGVVILCDLGSAILTAETAIDFLEDASAVRIADAPLVEGTVAAAVAAEGGASLDEVAAAARTAAGEPDRRGEPQSSGRSGAASPKFGASGAAVEAGSAASDDRRPEVGAGADAEAPERVSDTATLINREGLHARPAAEFVRLAAAFDAVVMVNGVDAKSLLRIMALGLTAGDEVALTATGPQAADAVRALAGLVRSGFGES